MNIAEILKDKPEGTKLYSLIHGNITLLKVRCTYKYPILINVFRGQYYDTEAYAGDGKYFRDLKDTECVLFPSKKMKDWNKFQWTKGDVLIDDNNNYITFKKWTSDDYTCFEGVNSIRGSELVKTSIYGWTSHYHKASMCEEDTYFRTLKELKSKEIWHKGIPKLDEPILLDYGDSYKVGTKVDSFDKSVKRWAYIKNI